MDVSGEYRIAMPREAVWRALMDPDVLRRCVPGCDTLERTAPDAYRARVALVIGPVRAKFDTDLKLSELKPYDSYRLSGMGRGGAIGFGQGQAEVALDAPEEGVTTLRYTAGFQVGGRLAQLGSRLVLGTTRKLADDFFAALVGEMAADAERVDARGAIEQRLPRYALALLAAAAVLIGLLAWWLLGSATAA